MLIPIANGATQIMTKINNQIHGRSNILAAANVLVTYWRKKGAMHNQFALQRE